jgi:hypothetical protein
VIRVRFRLAEWLTVAAATDSGFSTSWSKDGRKFAVASQGVSTVSIYFAMVAHIALRSLLTAPTDGQVTVWDHRYVVGAWIVVTFS